MAKIRSFVSSLIAALFALLATGMQLFFDGARRLHPATFKTIRRQRLKAMASFAALLALLLAPSGPLQAQVFFSNLRVTNAIFSHTTVGTSTADAISDSAVSPGLLGWKLCNDAVNTSTYLLVGEASDVSTDGVMIGPGICFECPNCTPSTLKAVRVEGQAASNGYSIVQFKQ